MTCKPKPGIPPPYEDTGDPREQYYESIPTLWMCATDNCHQARCQPLWENCHCTNLHQNCNVQGEMNDDIVTKNK